MARPWKKTVALFGSLLIWLVLAKGENSPLDGKLPDAVSVFGSVLRVQMC